MYVSSKTMHTLGRSDTATATATAAAAAHDMDTTDRATYLLIILVFPVAASPSTNTLMTASCAAFARRSLISSKSESAAKNPSTQTEGGATDSGGPPE